MWWWWWRWRSRRRRKKGRRVGEMCVVSEV
jgi:hypothetical protein